MSQKIKIQCNNCSKARQHIGNINLRSKLIISFFTLSILPLVIFAAVAIKLSINGIEQQTINQMISVRDLKASLLDTYFNSIKGHIKLFVTDASKEVMSRENTFVVNVLHNFNYSYEYLGNTPTEKASGLIHLMNPGANTTTELSGVSDYYLVAHADYHPKIKSFTGQFGIENIYFINNRGDVIYATYSDGYLAMALESHINSNLMLSKLYRDVKKNVEANRNEMLMSGFANDFLINSISNYTAIPLFQFNQFEGMVVFRNSMAAINNIMQERSGLGDTGETYLVNADFKATSILYRASENSIINMSSQLIQSAFSGNEDHIRTTSYLNDEVIGAYTTVDVFGEPWVLIAEITSYEAFAAINNILLVGALIIGVTLLSIALVGVLLSGNITQPLVQLTRMSETISSGDYEKKIAIDRSDEVGRLATSFSLMQVAIQEKQAANHQKLRFLAEASHDLRQPLHAMGLFISALDSYVAPSGKNIFSRLKSSYHAITTLFDALLDITRLDANVISVKQKVLPVEKLFQLMEQEFSNLARKKGIEFHIVNSSLHIMSDCVLLERIIRNLLSNAIRYTDTGRVVLGCRRHGDLISIQIWDTGPGLTPKQQREIFGEFVQVQAGDVSHSQGLGLGLSIVERLTKLLDHPLTLKSCLEKGSVFAVEVPVAIPLPGQKVSPENPLTDLSIGMEGLRVIVIDDDHSVRESMTLLLQEWGCSVIAVATISEMLSYIEHHDYVPHLLLADLGLAHGETGLEAISKLRRYTGKPVDAAIITADYMHERIDEIRKQQLQVLCKPLEPAQLRALLLHFRNKQGHAIE